jgi:hypothetical protein
VRPCVRPQLADTDPAHSGPSPADPAASAATYAYAPASAATASAATASAAATSSYRAASTGSTASYCTASTASRCAASAPSMSNFIDELRSPKVFLVEDIERRQADVRNFLVIERNFGKRVRCLATVRSLSEQLLMRRLPSPTMPRRPPISVGLPSDAFALKLASRAPW